MEVASDVEKSYCRSGYFFCTWQVVLPLANALPRATQTGSSVQNTAGRTSCPKTSGHLSHSELCASDQALSELMAAIAKRSRRYPSSVARRSVQFLESA